MTIRNPAEWGADNLKSAAGALRSTGHALNRPSAELDRATPTIRPITIGDLFDCLRRGFDDFGAYRTDVLFVSIIYPLAGLVLARVALGYDMLPMVFPLMAGFALIGPVAAAGLYEMSRRREAGLDVSWTRSFAVFGNPSIAAIVELGLVLGLIFIAWLAAAMLIYNGTLGPQPPTSVSGFLSDVFGTGAGWGMIVLGVGVGFLFALLVLAISSISFPLLIDRRAGVLDAVRTSVRAMAVNPVPMLAWGLIVAAALVLGAIPLFWGLIIVMPVLGHATWHLYRKLIEWS